MKLDQEEEPTLTPRPYQLEGIEFLTTKKRAAIFDEMGVGKSMQAILAAHNLNAKTILIICPKFSAGVWQSEILKWWPESAPTISVIMGNVPERQIEWNKWHQSFSPKNETPTRIILTNFVHLHEIKEVCRLNRFDCIIIDECHKITNRQTIAFKNLKRMRSDSIFFLSGTPIRKSASELWSILHLIDPMAFSSFWQFIKRYFYQSETLWGSREIMEPTGTKLKDFKALTQKYYIRRMKKDVHADLPKKTRVAIPLQLNSKLREAYNSLVDEYYVETSFEEFITVANRMILALRLRQLCVTPQHLELGVNQKIVDPNFLPPWREPVQEILDQQEANGKSTVIFVTFKSIIPHVHQITEQPILELVGGLHPNVITQRLNDFKTSEKPQVLVSTIQMAQSWEATKADTAIFLGFDWSPVNMLQAEDRLHRMGQENPVTLYYPICSNTIEEHVLQVMFGKVRWSEIIFDKHTFLEPGLPERKMKMSTLEIMSRSQVPMETKVEHMRRDYYDR